MPQSSTNPFVPGNASVLPAAAGQTTALPLSDTTRANSVIESMGVYLPPRTVSTADILSACTNRLLVPMERLTGIRFRRMAGDKEYSIDLASQAIRSCLSQSKYRADEVELLVCCNISRYDGPNFQFTFEPSTAVRLKEHFGMTRALAFDLNNACAGMFTGVNLADAYLKAGLVRNALVVSGEYITHLTRTAQREITGVRDPRMSCLTLGDSGAAVLLERSVDNGVGFHFIDMATLGAYSEYCIAKPTRQEGGGAIMVTDSENIHRVAISESVQQVVSAIRAKMPEWGEKALDYLIMHQTWRGAIDETKRLLVGILPDLFKRDDGMINNLPDRGNTSSTSHFVAFWDNIQNKRLQAGDKIIFAVQASGITIGTAPYTLDNLAERMRLPDAASRVITTGGGFQDQHRSVYRRMDTRICIESMGIVPPSAEPSHDSLQLVVQAAEDCLSQSQVQRGEISILMFAGVHRNEFICEPAIAAMVAGKLGLNAQHAGEEANTTFGFDIFNGAMSFLNACYSGIAFIRSKRFPKVMVAASEIENNLDYPKHAPLGLKETGAAAILQASPDGQRGFRSFLFRYDTRHIGAFYSYIGQDQGQCYLRFRKDPKLEEFYLEAAVAAVKELLDHESLTVRDLAVVLPPQIPGPFIGRLAERLGLPPNRMPNLARDGKDYFTCSLAHGWREWQAHGRLKSGDLGLFISVGTGVQVGCALYQF
jgi:3-oxoacyl-[acyl-carrier-protein] synthase III